MEKERGHQVDEVRMLISGMVESGGRKVVRVSFLRERDYADGLLPEGIIEKAQGFTDEEVRKLEDYLRFNRQEILKQAKEINPLRSWLKG